MKSSPSADLPTIPAAPNRLGELIVAYGLVRPAVWAAFHTVWLASDGPLPHPADGPLIFYMNHPGWWDGYMAYLLHHELFGRRVEGYLMMEEAQLSAFRFFAWCGAFSVDRHSPRSAERSVRYIAALLRQRRSRALWILPQGMIVPPDRRPIALFPGTAWVAQRAGGALLVPVAMRYEFGAEQQPEVFVRLGEPHRAAAGVDRKQLSADVTDRLTATLDRLRDDVVLGRTGDYRPLLRGRVGIDKLTGSLGRWLARRISKGAR